MNDNVINETKRLNFENILWIIFVFLSIMNIVSNNFQKDYVVSNDQYYEDKAKKISIFVLTVLLFVYLYFFIRNYNMYNSKGMDASREDFIKVMGSVFFILATLCLLYFQVKSEDNFIGGPAL